MLVEEILESLKSLTQKHGIKISEIERECNIPKNSLASIITGKRVFPLKHKERLQEYCKAKEIGIILGSAPGEKLDGRQWVSAISDFCEKRGWKAEQLIEKFEQLEREMGAALSDILIWQQKAGVKPSIGDAVNSILAQYKPNTAPQIEKRIQDEQEFKKGQEKAEISPETGLEIQPMPAGLSPIQQAVWRNNHKMKGKKAPLTQFGVTKKEKNQ